MTIEGESIMLPAKFASFASRVCSIAQKVFSVSDTDNANSVADAPDGSDSTYYSTRPDSDYHSAPIYSYSNMQVNSSSSSLSSLSSLSSSSLSDNDSLSLYVGKTARKSHIFRNTILAIIVTFATIVTMLIVPPVKQANAASVWWDYAGNGYVAPTTEDNRGRKDKEHTYDAADAFRDMRIEDPVIEKENGRTKVTYKIIFNRNAEFARQLDSGEMQPKGNKPKDGTAYVGKPTLSVFLPKGLDKESIHVKRYWEGSSGKIHIGDTSAQLVREDQTDMNIHTRKTYAGAWTAWTYTKNPNDSKQFKGFNDSWEDNLGASSGDNGVGGGLPNPYKYSRLEGGSQDCQYGMCEIYKWNNNNLFETLFASLEWDAGDKRFTWIVSAYLENGYTEKDVYTKMPVAAGFRSSWRRNKYAVFGPFDTDGDGIPDYVEHLHNMNPKGVNDIDYPQYNDSMLKDYGKDNVPLTTYGRPVTVKPIIKTGKWEGDSSTGKFKYDGKTSSDLPDDIGIRYSIVSKSDNTIRTVDSLNNMPEGSVYINPKSGYITYNPRKTDKYKTFTFGTKITYPNPELYNCNNSKTLEYTHDMKVKVIPQSWIYNPVYTPINLTEKTGDDQASVMPIVYASVKSVRDNSKKNADIIQTGDLPEDATFEPKQYVNGKNRSDPVLDWSSIENQDLHNGKVRFYSNKWREGGKYHSPVIVTYADGSKSTDPDAGNADKNGDFKKSVVYATVNVKRPNPKDPYIIMNIHSGVGGSNLGDNGTVYADINSPLNPGLWIDSWSRYKTGKISLKSLCWKETIGKGGKVEKKDYTFSNSNEDSVNSFSGLTFKQTEKWAHASDNDQQCWINGKSCNRQSQLYDDDQYTIERSRGEIKGSPNKGGKYVCRVFALSDGSDAKNKFDAFVKENKHDFTLPGNSKNIEWVSKDVNIVIRSLAHKYNPRYTKVEVQAGGKAKSDAPESYRGANGVNKGDSSQNDLVQDGTSLPKGTWFELKKYSKHKKSEDKRSWSNFEGKDSNKKKDDNKPEDTKTDTKYGQVTFAPLQNTPINDYLVPVIVHYSDGSTSEDDDSGNRGMPVYAPVSVVSKPVTGKDLKLNVYSNRQLSRHISDNDSEGMRFRKGDELRDLTGAESKDSKKIPANRKDPMFFDSWSSIKQGKIYQHMLCYEINQKTGAHENYKFDEVNGLKLAGRKGNKDNGDFEDGKPSQWTRSKESRKQCNKNNSCNNDLYLYGDERDTTERTRGWLRGKVEKNGDFVCTVYAIKDLENKGQHGGLQTKFEKAVKDFVNNQSGKTLESVINGVLTNKEDSKNPQNNTMRHVDWESVTFPIHVHSDAHYYNPEYVPVTVKAGNKITTEKPKSVKPETGGTTGITNSGQMYKDMKLGDLPQGTKFKLKQYKNDDKHKVIPWSFMKKSSGIDYSNSGEVTFYPDVTISAKDYETPVVVTYPDGSTSEDEDAGNQGKPVYAKVKVEVLKNQTNNLQLKLYKDKDPQTGEPMNGELNDRLYVMNGISLLRKPFIRTWSLTSKNKLNLRMLCHKDGASGNWTSDEKQSVVYIPGNGSKSTQWKFANEVQQTNCRERGNCNAAHTLYGFINDQSDVNSVKNAIARTEDIVDGTPKQTGSYKCTVFTLDDAALKRFNALASDNTFMSDPSNSGAHDLMNNNSLSQGTNWERLTFNITVVEPFKLPKTGGEDCVNWNVLLSVVCVIGTGAMAAGFFLDQTKWGRAMLEALLRKTLIKDFICKTAKKLRALRRRSERWRC